MPNAVPGSQVFGSWDFKFAALSHNERMQGATMSFNGFPFLFAPFAGSIYRPREIAVKGKGAILFVWDKKGDDQSIVLG
jgi:hypothetical protein